ncbi:MAG: tetratricopeptide repeat protein [Bacteroidota bacterium]
MRLNIGSLCAFLMLVTLSACAGQNKLEEGKKALEKKAYEAAEKLFGEALKEGVSGADEAEAYWGRGKSRLELGKAEPAGADFEQAVQKAIAGGVTDSVLGKYLFGRGTAKFARIQFSQAAVDFLKARDLQYDVPNSQAWYGVSLGNADQPVEAIQALTKAMELDPNNHYAVSNRGFYNALLGDNSSALSDLTKAIALKADDKLSMVNRGYTYVGMGEFEKAIVDFQAALAIDENDQSAIMYMGIAYTNSGQNEKALPWLDKAIANDPDDSALYYYRGVCRLNLGQKDGACEDLREAFERGSIQGVRLMEETCE